MLNLNTILLFVPFTKSTFCVFKGWLANQLILTLNLQTQKYIQSGI